MSTASKYVILGTGQLGLAIMDELIEQGHSAKLVNRSGAINEPLPEKVTVVTADANKPDQVAAQCAGAEIVFFCVQPPYNKWSEQFPPLAAAVIEGISRTGAKLVFGSNVYLYGPTNGQPIHEELPYAAQTRKGRARAQVADSLLSAHRQGKVQVVIGRASDFYGPRVVASMAGETLFAAALAGKTVNLTGNIDLPHTLTYIRDFARALITLGEHDEAYGQAWHIPSAETITTRQFIELVENEIDQSIRVRTAGKNMMRIVGLFNSDVREVVEMMYEFEEPFVIDHSRFETTFGNGVTPHTMAIKETVEWYRGQANA